MNWLAHAFLSKPDIEFRVGNILPDLVSITELKKFSPAIQRGIACHKAIDIFTDAHPIVKNSFNRLPTHYRRYGGILTDVFYDHFLAKHWNNYSSVSLDDFTKGFGDGLHSIKQEVSPEILLIFQRILSNKLFESYRDISGVKKTLQRIDLRLRQPVNLGDAINILEDNYPIYDEEFVIFFSELQEYIQPYIKDVCDAGV